MTKYCQDGGDTHTFDETGHCFECDAVRQSIYNARTLEKQAKAGLVRVSVMVPKDKAEEFKGMAKMLRAMDKQEVGGE